MSERKKTKKELEKSTFDVAHEYGISTVLFRNAVGISLGINVTDMECLAFLFFKGVSSPNELGSYTGLSSGATTAMLDRLERAQLIKRSPNPIDRRGTQVVVDKLFTKKIGPLFRANQTAQRVVIASYSGEQLELLIDFFSKLSTVWESSRQAIGQAD
jgi:DNA-binding MarR family transcriptional regulator